MNLTAKSSPALAICAAIGVAAVATSAAQSPDPPSNATTSPQKYGLKVPGGLAFSEFRGYEGWETVSLSQSGQAIAVILGNPAMIAAYKAGIPGNGKPFPDGAKFAKIHWEARMNETAPGSPTVAGMQRDVDFMVKDSKRFADSGGWGYAAFKYDPASNSFDPFTQADSPPQANDARCGMACHTVAKATDFVFTRYAMR